MLGDFVPPPPASTPPPPSAPSPGHDRPARRQPPPRPAARRAGDPATGAAASPTRRRASSCRRRRTDAATAAGGRPRSARMASAAAGAPARCAGAPGAMPPPSSWERTSVPSGVDPLPPWGVLILQGAARSWMIFAIVWGSIVFIGENVVQRSRPPQQHDATAWSPPCRRTRRASSHVVVHVADRPLSARSLSWSAAPEPAVAAVSDFERLVAEAAAAPVEGWDFSWFDGRATEERPPWGYARLMGERMAGAAAGARHRDGRRRGARHRRRGRPRSWWRPRGGGPTSRWPGHALHPLGAHVVAAADCAHAALRATPRSTSS